MPVVEYAQNYAKMSDDELTRIFEDRANLVPEATEAIEAELTRRGLAVEDRQEQPSSLVQPVTVRAAKKGSYWRDGSFGFLALALTVRFLITAYYHDHQSQNPPASVVQFENQMNADAAANSEFRMKLKETENRRTNSFAEFQQQMNDLEILLDSGEPRIDRGMDLYREMRKDIQADAVLSLPLFDRLFEDESRIFAIERELIACSKSLAVKPAKARVKFQVVCVKPAAEKFYPLADDELSIVRDLQKQGVKLPAEVQKASQ